MSTYKLLNLQIFFVKLYFAFAILLYKLGFVGMLQII